MRHAGFLPVCRNCRYVVLIPCIMPVYLLDDSLWFPSVDEANEDGLLAAGGDLSVDRLLLAYQNGIFPWFNEDEPPLWWSPDPRFVLFPSSIKVSKSMRQVISRRTFEYRTNTSFEDVIYNCSHIKRKGSDGTWITDDVLAAYTQLHHLGYAHSAEAWQGGALVGGLYGVKLGNVFFGESMFAKVPDASKFAFISCVHMLQEMGVKLIDCQVYTDHLASLGAEMIPRPHFVELLGSHIAV